jgi:hypothetical protein
MIMLHPLAARVKKPVGIFWSGLFAIKPPSHLSNKENQPLREIGRVTDDTDLMERAGAGGDSEHPHPIVG